MRQSIKTQIGRTLNQLLKPAGMKLVTLASNSDPKDYIVFRPTLAAAKQASLSVGDYIDAQYNQPGATQATIDCMAEVGIFNQSIERLCEIGPGSGRYLERTLRQCQPSHYEIYETADDWRNWLIKQYNVIAQPTDGKTLAATPSASIDLVQAHKVFSWIPFLPTCSYLNEMARVVRKGGTVVFDVITEGCMDEATLANWHASGVSWSGSVVPKQFTIDFFAKRQLTLIGSFFIPLRPGKTEYLIFRK